MKTIISILAVLLIASNCMAGNLHINVYDDQGNLIKSIDRTSVARPKVSEAQPDVPIYPVIIQEPKVKVTDHDEYFKKTKPFFNSYMGKTKQQVIDDFNFQLKRKPDRAYAEIRKKKWWDFLVYSEVCWNEDSERWDSIIIKLRDNKVVSIDYF